MKRLLGAAAALLLVLLFAVPAVLAAGPDMVHTGRVLISTGGDITVPAGEQADAVIVVDGIATIEGEVNTVVVVDGTAVLTGARSETVVAVRSPVTLNAGTIVLGDVMTVDSLVTKFGDAAVRGTVRDVGLDLVGVGFFLAPLLFLFFIGFALAAIVAGLLVAGLAARQVRAAEELISRHPLQTLGVGIIGIFVPILLVVPLFVSVVGAPLAIAVLFGLWPAVAFLGYLVAGIWIGDWILRRASATPRERPYLAAVVGLVVLQLAAVLPILSAIASLFGYGAVLLLGWRTLRGDGGRSLAPQSAPMPMPG